MEDSPVPPVRVDYDDLELDDQLALLDGKPFTGVVFGRGRNGKVDSEGWYQDGLPEGVQREWYPNGQLERRYVAVRGRGIREMESWYPNGQRRAYRAYVEGRLATSQAWDAHGQEIDPATLADAE